MRLKATLRAAVTTATVAAALGLTALGSPGLGLAGTALASTTTAPVAPTLPGGTWSAAQPLPVPAAIAGNGKLLGISCAAPGNCTAIGTYPIESPAHEFAVNEVNGVWQLAQTLSVGGTSDRITAGWAGISCAAPGDCVTSVSMNSGKYLISEAGGTWGAPHLVPVGAYSTTIDTITCPATGSCTAAGTYQDTSASPPLAYTIDEVNGSWGAPRLVAGITTLISPPPNVLNVSSLSCGSPGNCTVGGSVLFSSAKPVEEGFLVTEANGTWGSAYPVPGIPTGTGTVSEVTAVSCTGPGDCTAVGDSSTSTTSQVFAIDSTDGTWGAVQALSFPAGSEAVAPDDVSCASPGNCAVTDSVYLAPISGDNERAYIAYETNGTWSQAEPPAGLPSGQASVGVSVSCATSGYCAAIGKSGTEMFAANYNVLHPAANSFPPAVVPLQGTTYDGFGSVSCAGTGYCTAVGDAPTPYAINEATGSAVVLSAPQTLVYGNEQAVPLSFAVTSPAGMPTGSVSIQEGSNSSLAAQRLLPSLCTGRLGATGTGSCRLAATALPAGTLTVAYSGDVNFVPADLIKPVLKAKSSPHLALSSSDVAVGTRQVSGAVTVAPQYSGTPTGQYQVYLDGKPTGLRNLSGGHGTFTLATGSLKLGRHTVAFRYQGDSNFNASSSATVYLTIGRATTTTLRMSHATITSGHENAEKLTVPVSHVGSTYATGKVTLEAVGKSGVTTLATVYLYKGTATFTFKASQLKPGTYYLMALYSGDGNYAPSGTVKGKYVLKVVS